MKNKLCKNSKQMLLRMPIIGFFLFVMLFATACSSENEKANEAPVTTPVVTQAVSVGATPTGKVIEFDLGEMKEIFYYTVNPETCETEAVSAVVNGELADEPDTLMMLVTDSLEDVGYEIGVRSTKLDGENVVVDFYSDMYPVTGLTREEEKAVLDAIAQSLLDNLTEQNGVVFRVMGEAYKTENFSFGQYYVYMKNQHK